MDVVELRLGRRPVTVDLDLLTPMARALAESVLEAGGAVDIRLESDRPLREIIPEEDWQHWTDEQLDRPHFSPWRGWGPSRNVDPVEYLERYARKLPIGYHPAGALGQRDGESPITGGPDGLITRDRVLALLRQLDQPVHPGTWSSYVSRGHAPQPAHYIGRTPLWAEDDIRDWAASRPGQGARTDLRDDQ